MRAVGLAIILFAGGGAALAADLPERRMPPVLAPVAPPTFTWTGFYLGGNAGADINGGSTSSIAGNDPGLQVNIADGLRPAGGQIHNDGFSGGGQIGYNYQFGAGPTGLPGGAVVGVEADAAYTDIRGTATYFSNRLSSFASRTDFVGTVRGRLGYAFNNVLLYGTGGFAYGGTSNLSNFYGPAGNLTYQGSSNSIRTGYAFGGGIEAALPTLSFLNPFHAGAVTVKAEYLRYELGSTAYTVANTSNIDPGYTQRIRNNGNLVRVGLNYKFGLFGAPTPVVARY